MRLFYLTLYLNLLLVTADETQQNGYCDKNQAHCEIEDGEQSLGLGHKKLLFYDVNPPEGFNLRRDVYMRFAIMVAEAYKRREHIDWRLILPPWYSMYHWKTESYHDPPKPWSMFFDVPSLKTYAPVLELHEVMQKSGKYGLKIDSLYVLQNFDDPFEGGDFRDKWNVLGPCEYDGHYWGYHNITAGRTICIEFQGDITQLWEIMDLQPSDRKVMFYHGEVPLHSTYGTKTYWDCRKSMQFNTKLVEAADKFIIEQLGGEKIQCDNYLALHWRRQDFLRTNRSPSIKGTVEQIHKIIMNKYFNIKDIFVASDGTDQEINLLQEKLNEVGLRAHFYLPDVHKFVDGQVAIVEQIICSRGAFFIGTYESTFTYRIQEEREIMGFDSDTTFNRLCPDKGTCERPSRWTIVH